MANAKKQNKKTKNGTFSNNMFCATCQYHVMGIWLMFCQWLKLEFSDSLLRAIFALLNCEEWFNCNVR